MGNTINNPSPENIEETNEWLDDLENGRTLDISRKVNHSQFIQHVHGNITEASLSDIPWSILEQISLYNRIDASYNNINQISANLALRIPHLVYLNLSYNNVTSIPRNIALLFHLEELLLRGNKLLSIPDEICLLENLKMLDLSYNKLQQLPKDMGKLKNLSRLNISYNALTKIPLSLGSIKGLGIVIASSNCSMEPPQEICNSSVTLLAYLRDHAPEYLPCKALNSFPRVRANIARSQLDDDIRTQNVSAYVQSLTQTQKPASRLKTPLLLPTNATSFRQDDLRDKIVGLVYGAVLGDTLGVATELLPKEEIEFYYGSGRLEHAAMVNDEHRSHFRRGKTTCVSDLMLLILDCVIQWSGVLDELEIARRLVDYSSKGIKDLNSKPFITSAAINHLLLHNRFPLDPHGTSLEVAQKLQKSISEDLHILPMGMLAGLPQFYNLSEVQSNAIRVCRTTHNYGLLIQMSCRLASVIALLLQGSDPEDVRTAYETGKMTIDELLPNYEDTLESQDSKQTRITNIVSSCLQSNVDFEVSLTRILSMGEESRISGTICGGILGCIVGYTQLPARWLNGLDPSVVTWLNGRLNTLLDMMGLP